jgi:cytochrome c biogenesis protein CcdA
MLRLVGLAVSIGLADSLNPSTIAPALYLASGERARGRVVEFTIAVFAVYFLGGLAIALGPGQLIRSLLPHPHRQVAHIIEVAVGVALIAGAAVLWRHREQLSRRKLPRVDPHGRSSWVLGATITVVELPTAFPYFAVIAAIVGSGLGPPRQVVLLVLFNVCFVLPLIGIIGTLTFAGARAGRVLGNCRRFLQRRWPMVLSTVMLLAGVFVVLLGATGLAATRRGHFGRFIRHFRRFIRP